MQTAGQIIIGIACGAAFWLLMFAVVAGVLLALGWHAECADRRERRRRLNRWRDLQEGRP